MAVVDIFLRLFLLSVGIIPNPKLKFLELIVCFVITVVYILLLSGEIIAFISPIDNIYRIEIAYQILCFMYIGSTELVSKCNRHRLIKICDRINCRIPEFMIPAIQQKTETSFQKFMKIFVFLYCQSITVYILAPLINVTLKKNFDDPISLPLPYWFANSRIKNLKEYLCMNVAQNILCTISFYAYASSFAFMMCISITCRSHVSELQELLQKFTISAEYTDENELISQLKIIITYQQKLCSLLKDIAGYLGQIFSLALAWFILVAVLTLFMAAQIEFNIVFIIKIVAVVTNMVISFFFFCVVAQNVTDTNELIVNEFYTLPWYRQSIRFQKLLYILLHQSCRKLDIKPFGIYRMNVKLFWNAVRTIYSVLNIILLSTRKNL